MGGAGEGSRRLPSLAVVGRDRTTLKQMVNEARSGPVFVVGIWRSGTSLLYTLLNQHPQIALTYESDLFLLRSLFRNGATKADWLERWEFWNSALSRHDIDTSTLPSQTLSYPAAATLVWQQYAGQCNCKALYGEKSPNYFDCLQQLAREFPDARFVVIWRDLADTCRSIVRAGRGSSFFAKRGITHRALIGYRRMKRECDALERLGIPLHQIHYEEMIESPEAVMTGICSFLNISFDARMTSLDEADRSAIYEAPQHAGVRSTKIELNAPREEVLSPELQRKIAGYVAFWKKESKGVWPRYPETDGDADPVGALERALDGLHYRVLRAFDRFTAWVYCYAPIGWLRKYRGSRTGNSSEQKTQEPAALSEVPTRH